MEGKALMKVDRRQALDQFARYAKGYDPDNPLVRLKIDHTYRVTSVAARVAASLGLPDHDVDLAWLCGLLHDIGRFEQVRRFNTFNDAASVDHAKLSCEVLFGDGLIEGFRTGDDEDAVIRRAIALHNVFELPADLDERTRLFAQVLRDADKIDILKVNCVSTCEAVYGITEGEMRASALSSAVEQTFYRHETVLRETRVFPADLLASHICFFWGLVYPKSVELAVEQGYVFEMLAFPFENDDTRRRFQAMDSHLREWISRQPGSQSRTA